MKNERTVQAFGGQPTLDDWPQRAGHRNVTSVPSLRIFLMEPNCIGLAIKTGPRERADFSGAHRASKGIEFRLTAKVTDYSIQPQLEAQLTPVSYLLLGCIM